jgi:adenine-specific DNA-methyltransferase
MDKLKLHTPDLTAANIEKLAALFPGCITEARDERGTLTRAIDFDQLRQELANHIVEGPRERYHLDWPGKREALLAANAPIAKTLRPCREESVDFDTTKNLFIEGDNLDALKLLQETYLGKVKMIYIDPPYNTGNDFLYEDDFAGNSETFFRKSNQKDEAGNRMVANLETNGRFHSDWLNMIYSRLKLARNLLADNGVILISIDDHEVHNLRKICDEIFGEANFIGIFSVVSSPSAIDYGHMAKTNDYCVFYAKDVMLTETWPLEEKEKTFRYQDEQGGFNIYPLYNGNTAFNPQTRPNLHYPFYVNPNEINSLGFYQISLEKSPGWVEVFPVTSKKEGISRVWRWGKPKAAENLNDEIVGYKNEDGEFRIVQKSRLTAKVIRSILEGTGLSTRRGTAEIESLFKSKLFPFPKPTELIKMFSAISLNESDIALDFFSGSATTAHSVLQLNAEDGGKRRFVMVQLPEACDEKSEAYKAGYKTIAEIAKERIRRAGTKIKSENATTAPNLDIGFRVLKIDTSNMADVYYAPDAVKQTDLVAHTDNIKPERTPEDLLFQVLVDWGVDLSLPIRAESMKDEGGRMNEFTVFFVDENALAACFDAHISEDLVKQIAGRKPLRAVFRDSSYDSDSVKINVEQIFKLLSPETEVKTL